MSTIYLSEKKEYRALDFSKFVAAFLAVSYTHLTLPTICSV